MALDHHLSCRIHLRKRLHSQISRCIAEKKGNVKNDKTNLGDNLWIPYKVHYW